MTPDTEETRRESIDRLVPIAYAELRRIAHAHLRARGHGHSVATTGLVHEAYLRLAEHSHGDWRDRAHFMALAAVAMRHVLIDRARAQAAVKRGGAVDGQPAFRAVTLDENVCAPEESAETLLAIDDALTRLADVEPRLAQVVECRFYGGLSEDETAEALGVTTRTVQRDWAKARMLLRRALE